MRRRGSARRHDLRTPTGGRRRVGRLRAKEVRGTSAARPDDRPHASRSFGRIVAAGWSAVPKQGNGLPCGGVGGECQTGASYEKHSPPLPLPFGEPSGCRLLPLTGRQSQPLRSSPAPLSGEAIHIRRELVSGAGSPSL